MGLSTEAIIGIVVLIVIVLAVIYRRRQNQTIFIPSNTTQLTGNGWALACMYGAGTMQVNTDKKQVTMYFGNQFVTDGNTYQCL